MSTICRRIYFSGQAYRSHLSVTKTDFFENALQTGAIWKHRFCVSCGRKNIFRKWWRNDNHVISWPSISQTQIQKWPVDVALFKNSSVVVWTENIWCVWRAIETWRWYNRKWFTKSDFQAKYQDFRFSANLAIDSRYLISKQWLIKIFLRNSCPGINGTFHYA